MGKLYKQTLHRTKTGFGKIMASIAITIVLMNIALDLIGRISTSAAGLSAIGVMGLGGLYCLRLVYGNLAQYEYRIIEEEVYLERAIGKANHIFHTIQLDQMTSLKPYDQATDGKVSRGRRMGVKGAGPWYLLTYQQDGDQKKLIFQPDETFRSILEGHITKRTAS